MATIETTVEKGFLEKLKDSFKGVLLGLILIPVSFVVVYYASQREQSSEILEKSLPYEQLSKAKEKKLPIFIEGNLKANPISDELYLKQVPI
jgi:predicted negative regulator of RcsB-dependent stress response